MARELRESEVTYTINALPEDQPIRGNVVSSCGKHTKYDPTCADCKGDREIEDKLIAELESGNLWVWCCVEVVARYEDWTGSAFLGCCSYESRANFERDSYCDDLKREALAELQKQYDEAHAFKWTVEIEVDPTWVRDGFNLTDERAQRMITRELSHATGSEVRARVVKAPKANLVAHAQAGFCLECGKAVDGESLYCAAHSGRSDE